MQTLIVDRLYWDALLPQNDGVQHGALLNRTGTMSILGFYLKYLGVPDKDLLDMALPFAAGRKHKLQQELQDPNWVDEVLTADRMGAEDDLKDLFELVGINLEFVGRSAASTSVILKRWIIILGSLLFWSVLLIWLQVTCNE